MFGKCAFVVLMIASMTLLASACSREDQTAVSGSDTKLEEELARSSEARELISIRDELAALAIARGVTGEQIRRAGNDAAAANALLGLTEEEARAKFARIDALLSSLGGRFPVLAEQTAEARATGTCAACGVDEAAARWDRISPALAVELSAGGASMAPQRGPLVCRMQQLIVGFALCAARSGGSGIIYAICSWAVFCSTCDGGMADIICH